MGSPRLPSARLRTVLIASALAVAAAAAGVWVILSSGAPSEAAQSAAAPPIASPSKKTESPATPRSASPTPTKSAKPTTTPAKKSGEVKAKSQYKVLSSGSCEASYYWEGQMTASGEVFDPSELTAAHKTLPMNTKVRVTNKNNGESVVVRINDRGPYIGGRCLDLSKAAMAKVGGTGAGVIPVKYEILGKS